MEKNDYNLLHGYFIEDLKVGQQAILSKTVTESDIVLFAGVTGDNNPVHTSDDFAKKTIFKKKVAHGFLTASFISTVIGTKLPGPGSIYINQTLKFCAPVFCGDTIKVKVKVKKIDLKTKRVDFITTCEKGKKKIIDGEAQILVSSKY